MTFNTQHCLNFLEQKIDFQLMADTIKKFDPDFVGLNEIRGKGTRDDYDRQTEILASLTGYKYYYFAKAIDVEGTNPYGNAILSKIPIENAETVMIPNPDITKCETRCLLKASLSGGITVLVTHFGLSHPEQVCAVQTMTSNIRKEKCILMGDFNVVPEDDVLNPIRQIMTDTADSFKAPLLSFPSDKPDRKIDYIFVSHDIKVISADIPDITASDHRPHIAEIII